MVEPTELERDVARAIDPNAFDEPEWDDAAINEPAQLGFEIRRIKALNAARAAIAECFRHRHTDRSVPCPLCGFVVRRVEEQPFIFDDEP